MMRRRHLALVRVAGTAVVGALALVGCVDDGPRPTAPPSPAPSLSDEALVTEAQRVYEGYLAAGEQLADSNDYDYTLLEEWTTREIATADTSRLREIEESGIEVTGRPTVRSFEAAAIRSDAVEIAACVDLSTQRHSRPDGSVGTPTERPDEIGLLLVFSREEGESDLLLVAQTGPGELSPCG